jgi:phage repressor protein C with HTH and peptisase S24 domain
MENIIDRLDKYMEIKGLNDNRVTVDLGLTIGLIGKSRNSVKKGLHSDTIEKILQGYPDLNPVWLLMGRGEMLIKDVSVYPEVFHEVGQMHEPENVFRLKTDKIYEEQRIPFYNIEASAGVVSLFNSLSDKAEPAGYISIPNLPKCDGSIPITGDSMYPLLKSGDVVAYKIIELHIDNIFFGEMYLVSMDLNGDDHLSAKWVQKSEKGDEYIKLVSQNQHHQSKDVHLSKVRALALIKASVRMYSMA